MWSDWQSACCRRQTTGSIQALIPPLVNSWRHGSSLILTAPRSSSWLLVAPRGSSRLLTAPRSSSWLLVAPRGSSRLLTAPHGSFLTLG
uniref:Uncharacterized protein n=1 Tax=Knipowitschia caucasica TaxID=637954 RepID=A0AAV2LM27_KNICA